ncbi:MAG: hypothetical protein LBF22_15465 [Deltaproteobacteria bacterium]|nr:hypothetical protein [Deltaproteobacteria bacterium]
MALATSRCFLPHLISPHLTSSHLTSPHLTSPHHTSPHLTSPHLTGSPLWLQKRLTCLTEILFLLIKHFIGAHKALHWS